MYNSQSKVYKGVMEDVIKNVREAFLNDGVDEQVLQELKQVQILKKVAKFVRHLCKIIRHSLRTTQVL